MPAPCPPGYIRPAQLAERWKCKETAARESAASVGIPLLQRRTYERGGVYRIKDIERAEQEGWQ